MLLLLTRHREKLELTQRQRRSSTEGGGDWTLGGVDRETQVQHIRAGPPDRKWIWNKWCHQPGNTPECSSEEPSMWLYIQPEFNLCLQGKNWFYRQESEVFGCNIHLEIKCVSVILRPRLHRQWHHHGEPSPPCGWRGLCDSWLQDEDKDWSF